MTSLAGSEQAVGSHTTVIAFHAVEERRGIHALLACQLQLVNLQQTVGTTDEQVLPVGHQLPHSTVRRAFRLRSPENLQHCFLPIGGLQHSPCPGIGTQSAHKVIDLLGRLRPVNLAGLFENLRGRF